MRDVGICPSSIPDWVIERKVGVVVREEGIAGAFLDPIDDDLGPAQRDDDELVSFFSCSSEVLGEWVRVTRERRLEFRGWRLEGVEGELAETGGSGRRGLARGMLLTGILMEAIGG